jgi:signal transduction histidine kinase
VRSTGSWAVIEVSDDGPGVPVEVEPRVFERNVSGGQSSGVGLALARTLVAADGGRLELLSARPAVFGMFLPTRPAAVPADRGDGDATRAAADEPDVSRSQAQATVGMAGSSASAVSSGNTQRR